MIDHGIKHMSGKSNGGMEACTDLGSPVRTGLTTALRGECEKARTSSKGERTCNRTCPVTLTGVR